MAAAAFVIACASYRWIETPIRRGDALRSRSQLLSAAAASSLVIIGASLVTSQQHGWPSRVPRAVASLADASDDFSRERERCHAHDARAVPYTRACVFGASGAPVRNVIWGDSHGVELSIALGARLRQYGGAVRQSTYSSCSAGGSRRPRRVGGCLRHNAALLRAILEDSVLTTVILVADYPPSEDGKFDSYFVETERVVSALTMGGKRVVLVAPHPTYDFPVPTGVALMAWRGRQPDTGAMAVADFRRRTRESFARLERLRDQGGIELIDPAALLCPGRVCATTMDGRVLYHDELHLSRSGAALVAQLFDSVLGA